MTALDNKGKPSEPQEASVLPHEAASASLARPRAIAAVQARAAGRASRIVAPLLAALLGLAVIYTLALGKSFLVPIALAFMTSLVLAPVVRWLEGMRIPRAVGAGLGVAGLLASRASPRPALHPSPRLWRPHRAPPHRHRTAALPRPSRGRTT